MRVVTDACCFSRRGIQGLLICGFGEVIECFAAVGLTRLSLCLCQVKRDKEYSKDPFLSALPLVPLLANCLLLLLQQYIYIYIYMLLLLLYICTTTSPLASGHHSYYRTMLSYICPSFYIFLPYKTPFLWPAPPIVSLCDYIHERY